MSRLHLALLDEEALELNAVGEVTPEEVSEDASEVIESTAEASSDIATSDEIAEVTETLEGLYATAKLFQTEGFNKVGVCLLAGSLDSIERRTGGAFSIPSITDYSSESAGNEGLAIALEGMGESIKKAWNTFLLMLKKVGAAISTFFLKLFNSAAKIKSRAEELEKLLNGSDYKDSSDEEVKGDFKWLAYGRAFDPLKTLTHSVKEYGTVSNNIKVQAEKYTKYFKELVNAAPSKREGIITNINNDFKEDGSTEVIGSHQQYASHGERTVNGVTTFTLLPLKIDGTQKCLSKKATQAVLKEVAALAGLLEKRKDTVKSVNDSVKQEIAAVEKLISEKEADADYSSIMAVSQKISVKKAASSLNNVANLSFRIALAGLRLGESCTKKLAVDKKDEDKKSKK